MSNLTQPILDLPEAEQLDTLEELLGNLNFGLVTRLVPRLEKSWGVSAKPKLPEGFGTPQLEEEEEAEQTTFTVTINEIGGKKIQVIKAVRTAIQSELKAAKAILDGGLPAVVKADVDRDTAELIKKALEDAGAVASIQ